MTAHTLDTPENSGMTTAARPHVTTKVKRAASSAFLGSMLE